MTASVWCPKCQTYHVTEIGLRRFRSATAAAAKIALIGWTPNGEGEG